MRLVFLLFLLISCSKQRETPSLVREIPVASLEEANRLAARAALRCESDCPENVGLLLAKTKTNLLTCTSFLVGENLLATNSHCLPYETKRRNNCENMEVVFAATKNFPEERIACASIAGYSPRPNAFSPDMAILSLAKPTKRKFAVLSQEGSETLRVKKINPLENASGVLVEESCRPTPNSYRFPHHKNSSSSVLLLSDCASQPGNSGSPVFNERGEVAAIFQANFSLNEREREEFQPRLIPGEKISAFTLATNANCLPEFPWSWRESCTALAEPEAPETAPAPPSSALGWRKRIWQESKFEKEFSLVPFCSRSPIHPLEVQAPRYQEKLFFTGKLEVVPVLNLLETTTLEVANGTLPPCP